MAASVFSFMRQVFWGFLEPSMSLITYLRDYSAKNLSESRSLALLNSTGECRYRLDSESSASLILPDGRTLGYAQYGQLSTGRAIFYLHGFPGSRMEIASWDVVAMDMGARLVAVDRPGIGWSSPQPDRTILDHAKDVEHLAQHLNLSSYCVLGISGGGPYALACAATLPADELKAVSIVCGLGPPDMGYREMNWSNWAGFTFIISYFPSFARWYWRRQTAARLDLSDAERFRRSRIDILKNVSKDHPKDVAVFGDVDLTRLYLRSSREAFAQGFDGFLLDGKLINNDFGFRIEDIRADLPIQLWYGKLDTYVPLSHGEQTAVRLGGRAKLRVEDETHASISTRREEILRELVGAM